MTDKIHRTKIHHYIRESLPHFFSDSDPNGIKVRYDKKRKNVKRGTISFLHFTLKKKNIETFQALS